MRDNLINILNSYLDIFPDEQKRQVKLIEYLNSHTDYELTDWNNFEGHVVAGGFIYAEKEKKFLVMWHKDLKMNLYPGGHSDINDKNPLETSKREVKEETGIQEFKQLILSNNELIPIDIDTHIIGYNERLNLPEHYHFDFRYLYIIDQIKNINIDAEELSNYKWIDINELYDDPNYGNIATKIKKLLQKKN